MACLGNAVSLVLVRTLTAGTQNWTPQDETLKEQNPFSVERSKGNTAITTGRGRQRTKHTVKLHTVKCWFEKCRTHLLKSSVQHDILGWPSEEETQTECSVLAVHWGFPWESHPATRIGQKEKLICDFAAQRSCGKLWRNGAISCQWMPQSEQVIWVVSSLKEAFPWHWKWWMIRRLPWRNTVQWVSQEEVWHGVPFRCRKLRIHLCLGHLLAKGRVSYIICRARCKQEMQLPFWKKGKSATKGTKIQSVTFSPQSLSQLAMLLLFAIYCCSK